MSADNILDIVHLLDAGAGEYLRVPARDEHVVLDPDADAAELFRNGGIVWPDVDTWGSKFIWCYFYVNICVILWD